MQRGATDAIFPRRDAMGTGALVVTDGSAVCAFAYLLYLLCSLPFFFSSPFSATAPLGSVQGQHV